MFLVLDYVCERVYGKDLTPGSVVVFICDSGPLTQSRLTLQSPPSVYVWKTRLCFVFPQIRSPEFGLLCVCSMRDFRLWP